MYSLCQLRTYGTDTNHNINDLLTRETKGIHFWYEFLLLIEKGIFWYTYRPMETKNADLAKAGEKSRLGNAWV